MGIQSLGCDALRLGRLESGLATMTCREFAEFLMQYLSGELLPAERSLFDGHLAECPDCVAYLRTYEETIRLEKAAFTDPAGPVPDDVPEDLVHAILATRSLRAN